MNLVVGASGLLGSEICRILLKSGKPARALVRKTTDAIKQEKLKSAGASLAYGDLKDSSTLAEACRGVSTVISTASSTFSRQPGDSIETVDSQGQISLVEAAKAAGVRQFIFISFPPVAEDFALQRAKRAVEKRLVESGLAYTILQPTCFTEVWLSPAVGFDPASARAQIYGSGKNKISWISFLDVARFAEASVENPEARNAVVRLGGPEALSPLEVVRLFEELSGRAFTVTHVPEDALRAQKAAATNSLEEAFAALMLYYARGDVIDMEPAFRIFPLLRSRLAGVKDHVKRSLGLA
jgi:NADH dehydrogenase